MHYLLIILVAIVALYILFKAAKIMIKVALVCAILLLAYVTNPNDLKHKRAVMEKAHHENEKINETDIHVKDYKEFSLTQRNNDLIGIGAFTKVWIFRLNT